MKLCEKRTLALYFLLRKRFGSSKFNIGDAWDVSKSYFTKKVFVHLFKRLKRLGLVIQITETEYELVDLCEVLERSITEYLTQRSRSSSSS